MNTYRHIKAEHEAGYRSKGKLEKALDEMRKKKRVTKVSLLLRSGKLPNGVPSGVPSGPLCRRVGE